LIHFITLRPFENVGDSPDIFLVKKLTVVTELKAIGKKPERH